MPNSEISLAPLALHEYYALQLYGLGTQHVLIHELA